MQQTSKTMDENEIVKQNLGLVRAVVNTFNSQDYNEREELFSCGLLALLRAIRKHDPTKGKLSTYAWKIVRREISLYFKQKKKYVEVEEQWADEQIGLGEYMPILTDEEQELVQLRLEGYTLKEISKKMDIKSRQVEYKLKKAYRKIRESNNLDD